MRKENLTFIRMKDNEQTERYQKRKKKSNSVEDSKISFVWIFLKRMKKQKIYWEGKKKEKLITQREKNITKNRLSDEFTWRKKHEEKNRGGWIQSNLGKEVYRRGKEIEIFIYMKKNLLKY